MSFLKKRPLFGNLYSAPAGGRSRLSFLRGPWKTFKKLCFIVGLWVMISLLIGIFSSLFFARDTAPVLSQNAVLYLEFKDSLKDLPDQSGLAGAFAPPAPTVRDMVRAIHAAAGDDRVKGIMARMHAGSFSITHIQEIRDALKVFRQSGKPAWIYSSSYGDSGPGLGRYYLAAAFDEIWMQPMGIVMVNGMQAEIPFLRGLLDKIGILPQFYQREDYKTAYESVTNRSITPENRETWQHIVDIFRDIFMADIPADRNITPEAFKDLVDMGLLTAAEALESRLVDRLETVDILIAEINEKITEQAVVDTSGFITVSGYNAVRGKEGGQGGMITSMTKQGKIPVKLIHIAGPILESAPSGSPPGFASDVAAAEVIAPLILETADDPAVPVIVLRIDSPGGSPVASESILNAIKRAQAKGKKIVVSMGSVAASGGYWVASSADYIFALPTTVTGSIGVVGGKLSGQALSRKLEINWDRIGWGENAGMWSPVQPFDRQQAVRVNAMMDQVYDGFLERVATGRNMPVEDVRKIAGGRVWMGTAAKENGLVDELGGLQDALDYAATLAGAEDVSGITVITLPKPKTTLDYVLDLLLQQGVSSGGWTFQNVAAQYFAPVLAHWMVMDESPYAAVYAPLALDAP